MKIAYLCHRIPYPPDKGDKIRAYHQLQALATSHEVDLFTLIDDPADAGHQAPLTRVCRDVTAVEISTRVARIRSIPYLATQTPLTVPYFYSSRLRAAFQRAVTARSYDRVFVYCSAMSQYVGRVNPKCVITDFVDVDSNKWMQYAGRSSFPMTLVYKREARCLRDFERQACEQSASVVVTTEREATLVREISARANVHVIANGVDTEFFSPAVVKPEPGAPTILFTGDMSYYANEDAVVSFAENVLPLVQMTIPSARFLIVGRNPGPNVTRLHNTRGVEVTGFVADVRAYLAQAQVSVAPLSLAAGIQNKIIEAMSYGLPVVATSRAAQGLASNVAAGIAVADAAPDMAGAIVDLLTHPDLARRRGMQGRTLVSEVYSWHQSAARLLQLIERPSLRQHTPEGAMLAPKVL